MLVHFFFRPPVPIGFACTACFVHVSKAHLLTRMKRVYGQSRYDRDYHDASIKTCTITPLSSSSATCSESQLAVIHPTVSSWMGAMPSRYCFSRFLCLPLVCAVSVLHVLCLCWLKLSSQWKKHTLGTRFCHDMFLFGL